jgi:hypothetical protein
MSKRNANPLTAVSYDTRRPDGGIGITADGTTAVYYPVKDTWMQDGSFILEEDLPAPFQRIGERYRGQRPEAFEKEKAGGE